MHCSLLTFEVCVETFTIVHSDSQEQVTHGRRDDDDRQHSCAQKNPTKHDFQIKPQRCGVRWDDGAEGAPRACRTVWDLDGANNQHLA